MATFPIAAAQARSHWAGIGFARKEASRVPESQNYRLGVIVPTYRHVDRLPDIIARLRGFGLPVLVIDDGNDMPAAVRLRALHDPAGGVVVERRPHNGGKGQAMKTGFRAAARLGWSHALQMDADGQHDIEAVPRLGELSRANPDAVICGVPVFDHSAPKARVFGRYLTHGMVWVETLSREISDSMCGFRIYPVAAALDVIDHEFVGSHMDYDTEILVHLHWRGRRVVESPVRVIYPEGNVSNFRMLRDNVRMTLLHIRLTAQMPVRVPLRLLRRSHVRLG